MMAMIMMTATIKGLKEIVKLNFMISRAKTVRKKKFPKKLKLRCFYGKAKKKRSCMKNNSKCILKKKTSAADTASFGLLFTCARK